MNKREISSEESEFVYNYVMKHTLLKPSISFTKVCFNSFIVISISISISLLVYLLLKHNGINISKKFFFLFFTIEYFIFQKKLLIGLIHLYQNYAPVEMRRRCMCKPTCSEYGELAIKKYGVFIGLIKLFKRLFFTCNSAVYFIDEP